MHEAGVAIKKALLADGKNPRSYVNATADFLNKWLDTVNDNSYINVASKYFSKDGNKTAKLEIVALDPAKITEPVFSSNIRQRDYVRDASAAGSLRTNNEAARKHRAVFGAFTVSQRTRFLSGLHGRHHLYGSTYTQNVPDHD